MKKTVTFLLTIIFVLFSSITTEIISQIENFSYAVKGKLVDENGVGLPGVYLQLYVSPDVYNTTSLSNGSFSFNNVTNVEDETLPSGYEVSNNFPNPFNPTTRFIITLPYSGNVRIAVYNLLGQIVTEQIDKFFDAGTNYVDIELNGLSNGFYLARITIDEKYTITKKMMLVYGTQHLSATGSGLNKQLNKPGNGLNKGLAINIDSLVATNTYIGRKSFINLPSIIGDTLDLGNLTIQRYCPGTATVPYLGVIYNTVQIGSQCWLKENLNVGTRIAGTQNQSNNSPTNFIEKYCYDNIDVNCIDYGGLYQWDEAMQYVIGEGAQGICPPGWHIPSYNEFEALKLIVNNDGNQLLKVGQGNGTNTSGFSALLTGWRDLSGSFINYTSNASFWNSMAGIDNNSSYLGLIYNGSNITLNFINKNYGYSIRCIQGEPTGTAPAIPILQSPANGATSIAVNPTLSWNASTGATSYTLQVSLNSNFTTFVYNQSGLTSTSQQISGLSNLTVYYWRVSATNSFGTSGYSTVWNFTTIGTEPPAPILQSPANGATSIAVNPTLSWNASTGATSYTLQVSLNSNFTTFVYNQSGLTSTSQQISGLSNLTVYYWRVSATNSFGTSGYSTVWNFTTIGTEPPAPILQSPANGATSIAVNPTLSWNASAGSTSYTLQVSTNSGFTTFVFNQNIGNLTSRQLTGLSVNTTYYWRVSATNSYGTSGYSDVWNFTTVPAVPPIPTLLSPANAATNVPIPATLCWNASTGATSYALQVSTSSGFTTFVYNQSGLTGTCQDVPGLNNSTVYYWRVNATNAGGTSNWATYRSFTTVPAPPAAPTLVSPTNGATLVALNPNLDWNASTGATSYKLQVSTSSGFTTLVYNDSGLTITNQQITGLSNLTTYYWRVSATNAGGTGNWSSVWSFTTIGVAPIAPILQSPANGATSIAVNPTLSWNASAGSTSYTLQVSTNSGFTTFVFNQNIGNLTSRQLTGLSVNTTYYWRVSATNSYGTSGYSDVWNFTTVPAVPPIPTLLSPANAATNVPIPATLCWNASTGATSYALQVSTSSGFTTFVYNQSGLTGTCQDVPGLNNSTVYYWRVNATNAGGTSNWATYRSFTTVPAPPAAPTLVSPTNGATLVALNPNLDWNASTGATSYKLQVSTSSGFTTLVYNDSGLTITNQQITGLSNLTTYYWRVSATNAGGTGNWSSVWSFTTIGVAPIAPILQSPANGATSIAVNPTLSWNASAGSTSYTLQVSTNSGFTTFVFNQNIGNLTSRQLTGLSVNTTYYWRVSATNSYGTSGYSDVWNFTTVPAVPPIPTLLSPANAATNVPIPATLCWNASTGATSYALQVSTSSGFTTFVYNQSGLTGTCQDVPGLNNSTVYYWRVNATNAGGTSNWATYRSFTTVPAPPAAPTLVSPTNGATLVALNPNLDWNASTGATSYKLQVSTSSGFTTLVYNDSGLTITNQQITGLSNLTTYYWRVSATNAGGTGNWSSVWSFTTIGVAPIAPILQSPANGATSIAVNPTLSWNASAGSTSYTLQVSTNSGFTTFVFNQNIGNLTSRQLTGLSVNTTYYWRVSATNSYGTSGYSDVWNFTTVPAVPPIPTLLSPANAATNVPIPATLCWNASTGATSYALQVSTSSGFTTFVYNQSGLTGTCQDVPGLNNSTVYYWRVNATNAGGTSNWATYRSFTTLPLTSLQGYAYYAGTTIPVSGVLVGIDGITYTTGSTGSYQLNGLTPGTKTLTATKTGYDPFSTTLSINPGVNSYNIEMTSAQYTYNIYGTIVDSLTLVPLQGVMVTVLNDDGTPSNLQTISDFSGYYQVPTVPQGQRIITYAKLNHKTHTAQLFISNSNYEYNVVLVLMGIPCPGTPTVLYEGKTYNTVQIGPQCWLKENLNVGTMIPAIQDAFNNNVKEKYCMNNDPNLCNTYGGLYQWGEAMQYSTTQGVQGICPPGWHLPTTDDFQQLIALVDGDGNALKKVGGGGVGTNTSGFSAVMTGWRYYYTRDFVSDNVGTFWSSTQQNSNFAYYLVIDGNTSNVFINNNFYIANGISVRCIKD